MSKLLITRHDVEEALRHYFEDYMPELYAKYDFDKVDLYFEDRKLGYLGIMYVVDEKAGTTPLEDAK